MRLMIACRAIDNMAGGVERQAISLANEMARRGHDVSLLTLDHEGAQAFYDIDSSVCWYKLGMGNPKEKAGWGLRFKRMKNVRQIMKGFKPDVVLAFQQGMFLTLRLYTLGMGIPVIAAERESPFRYDFIREGKHRNRIFQMFRLAPHITVQCESYPQAYPAYLRPKITVIPNAIYPASQFSDPEGRDNQDKILLCVGRLGYQKNQLVLLDAFSRIADEFPEWRIVFAGEGEGREDIQSKIKALDLEGRVELLGAVKDISSLYARAHVLCIPSRWEGFPNVLGEALAHGLPAVGYEGCGGVRDLISHGENGVLAAGNGDVDSLSEALATIMRDGRLRKSLGAQAVVSMQPYEPAAVYSCWERFLEGARRA
ncbi:MAG: glycosyltransferase family 4 protein [Alphaproteobacteria bacterium]